MFLADTLGNIFFGGTCIGAVAVLIIVLHVSGKLTIGQFKK